MKFLHQIVSQLIFLNVLGLLLFNTACAQLTEPFKQQSSPQQLADNPVDPCTDPMEYCPIDSGLAVLLVLGAGYGAIKYIMLNKQAKDPANQSTNR